MEPRRPRSLDRSGSRSRGALTYEQDEPVDISNRSFDSRRGTNTNKAGTIPHDDLIDEQPT